MILCSSWITSNILSPGFLKNENGYEFSVKSKEFLIELLERFTELNIGIIMSNLTDYPVRERYGKILDKEEKGL